MSQKTKITAFMVFKIILLLASLLLWYVGKEISVSSGGGFGGWLFWGFTCLFAMPLELLKNIVKGANEGAAEGANTYKIRDWGSSFTISNSPNTGALKGVIFQIIALVIMGPILLPIKMLGHFATIVNCIVVLRKINNG